jgi:myo-inositol-1(or 4)-monophosphatase
MANVIPVSGAGKDALAVAREVSYSAGEIIMEWWPKAKEVNKKGKDDIVTNVDRESEQHITNMLKKSFPDHGVYGEEFKGDDPNKGWTWIIDPIDGTRNYAWGIPLFSLVVALAKDGEVVVGVNYDPLHGEMFHAALGRGAYLNDDPVKVTKRNNLDGAVLGMDPAYGTDRGTMDSLQVIRKMWPRIGSVRIMGSSALGISYVAAGRTDIYFHHKLQPYDQAAGLILVEEAGGVITDRAGKRANLQSDGLIVSSSPIHQDFMKSTKTMSWRNFTDRPG